jgi:hypothetical protein
MAFKGTQPTREYSLGARFASISNRATAPLLPASATRLFSELSGALEHSLASHIV